MSSENPYEAALRCEPGAAPDRAARGSHVKHDVLIVVLSVLCLMIVGGGGSYLLARFTFPPGHYPLLDLSVFYWLHWGARVVGGFTGQLLAGFLLGRYLRRVSPWHVLLGFALYLAAIGVVVLFVSNPGNGLWVESVGFAGAVFQQGVHTAVLLGVVSGGILLGRKAQLEAKRKEAQRGTRPMDVETA